jgi:hypothetical protein
VVQRAGTVASDSRFTGLLGNGQAAARLTGRKDEATGIAHHRREDRIVPTQRDKGSGARRRDLNNWLTVDHRNDRGLYHLRDSVRRQQATEPESEQVCQEAAAGFARCVFHFSTTPDLSVNLNIRNILINFPAAATFMNVAIAGELVTEQA